MMQQTGHCATAIFLRPSAWTLAVLFTLASFFTAPAIAADQPPADAEAIRFFEQKVRPLLINHCYECHSGVEGKAEHTKGGLRLDSRPALLTGGDNGPAVVPGKADESLLMRAVRYEDPDIEMPPDGKLKPHEIEILEKWVKMGAPLPGSESTITKRSSIDIAAGRKHWAFQPLASGPVPIIKGEWSYGPIDGFIRKKQVDLGTEPTPLLDRQKLLRRIKFDLVGLPPTAEEIDAFVSDDSPDALERRVDRWLASPRYGERWARSWLELVRYCDVAESWAETQGNSYYYRDWTVAALNDDMPYDRFSSLQLAADQMPDARPADVAALGFMGMSPNYWKELQLPVDIIKTIVSDEYEERIHTFSSTFLGLNIACARCHDHKYDPITVQDYYALAGVFASTRIADRALQPNIDSLKVFEAHKNVKQWEAEVKKHETARKALVKPNLSTATPKTPAKSTSGSASTPAPAQTANSKSIEEQDAERESKRGELTVKIDSLHAQIAQAKATPGYDAPLSPAAMDGTLEVKPAINTHGSRLVYSPTPLDAPVEIRGNPNKVGEAVPRRFVSVLSPDQPKRFQSGSGRLELAQEMFATSQPLLARVMVNRLWKNHFGTGLVDTPSDFGIQGQLPTHPELLDDLAAQFIEHGWSMKNIHRSIVLSATYQQSARPPNASEAARKSYAGIPIRRLEVEQWRDAMLMVVDSLELSVGGPATELASTDHVRRTLYGTIRRRELTDLLRLNDFPDPLTHSPARQPTTTPLQQLYTLNSPFVEHVAGLLVTRLDRELPLQPAGSSTLVSGLGETEQLSAVDQQPSAAGLIEQRIRRAYQWLYGRDATDKEMVIGKRFVGDGTPERWKIYGQVLLASNEFLFID